MTETWLPVAEAPAYEVSDLGRVRSPRGILKPWLGSSGYAVVTLRHDGQTLKRSVHRLVMLTFAGPQPIGQEVRHRNGQKQDNRRVNLEWGTRSQNIKDQVRHGTHNNARKTHCPRGHAYTQENTYILSRNRRQCVTCTRALAAAAARKRKAIA